MFPALRNLAWKGILVREITAQERFLGKVLFPGNFRLGKVSWSEKTLAWKDILDREISAQERFLGKVLFPGKVSWAEKSLHS